MPGDMTIPIAEPNARNGKQLIITSEKFKEKKQETVPEYSTSLEQCLKHCKGTASTGACVPNEPACPIYSKTSAQAFECEEAKMIQTAPKTNSRSGKAKDPQSITPNTKAEKQQSQHKGRTKPTIISKTSVELLKSQTPQSKFTSPDKSTRSKHQTAIN